MRTAEQDYPGFCCAASGLRLATAGCCCKNRPICSVPRQGDFAMQHKQSAQRLAELHIKGNPLILYNAWDAGSAKAIANAGASAIATTSWAVAAAHGYADGESI